MGCQDVTNPGALETNLQGRGGMIGAQEDFELLVNAPGSVTKTTLNGFQVVKLRNGTTATLYKPTGSPGSSSAIQIKNIDGSIVKIKY